MNIPMFKEEIELKATYIFDLENAEITSHVWRCNSNGRPYKKIEDEYTKEGKMEARLLFQAIHNEPFFEKQCYTLTYMVPNMPEDYREDRKLVLSVSIYNEDGRLLIPHLCRPLPGGKGQDYWDSFQNILYSNKKKRKRNPFSAISVFNRIRILKYSVENNKIDLTILRKITVAPYGRGDICVCLPLPDENPGASIMEIVVQGDRLRENLKSVSENLDLKLKHLFITAPPGSGKERYSTYVHYGSARKGKPNKVDMTSPRKEVERMLRGSVVERGVFAKGLFAKAAGGTIIFDEIDKLEFKEEDSDRDLSYLLRPLDPGKYLPENGSQEMDVKDVAMIFMGSESPERLEKGPKEDNRKRIVPPDFFTRVSDPKVKIEHPLSIKFDSEFNNTFSCLVRYFYWKAIEEMALGETGLESLSKTKRIERMNNLLRESMLEKLDALKPTPTTAERRFIAYLVKWIGLFNGGSTGNNERFNLIKTIWFKVEPTKPWSQLVRLATSQGFINEFISIKRPSVREISETVRSFVRKNWHLAEAKDGELIFPNPIYRNSDSLESENGLSLRDRNSDSPYSKEKLKLADALALELSQGLKLYDPEKMDLWVQPDQPSRDRPASE